MKIANDVGYPIIMKASAGGAAVCVLLGPRTSQGGFRVGSNGGCGFLW